MKIIYIANTRIPNQKAHGFQISKTCEKFASLGNTVELWYPSRHNDISDDLFNYYNIKKNFKTVMIPCLDMVSLSGYIGSLGFYLQSILFSAKLLFRKIEKNSIIYTRDIFIAFLFRLKGFDVVYNIHNWSNNKKSFAKIFLNNNLKIVCNSEGTRKKLIGDGFKNSIAVPNGVDLEDYVGLGDKSSLRDKIGLPKDKKIVLYTGHFYKWKGVSIIIDSAKILFKHKDIIFVLVGGVDSELLEYSKKSDQMSNVIFTGHRLKKNIPLYLKSADVLILPNIPTTDESINYTSPLKMFEYMASGVPIIASDLPSLREVLNEKNSVLVEAGNSIVLAETIKKIIDKPVLFESSAIQSLEDVRKYTWDEYAKKILDFIKK